jgi:FlaA1/EpsC-like NDP-sugar epimerase
MGASKKLMEELIMSYSAIIPIKTARFANVAFSNGSLPLGFLDRLNKKQPWSCPLGIRRFFVSPQESGELCLLACIMGESGDIFYPKLDEEKDMIPFDQIALALLNTLGLKPDICKTEEEAKSKAKQLTSNSVNYPVYFFGSNTSGEKSFEEFYTDEEQLDIESFINLGVIKNSKKRNVKEIDDIFTRLKKLFESDEFSKSSLIEILNEYLPSFQHIEKGKGLDQNM